MADVTAQHLAANLKRMREARGWSQQQLADCSGVPRPTIANLESGEGNPTLNVMLRVAAALGASLEELISDTHCHLEVHASGLLPASSLGQTTVRKLHSDASGIDIERFDLPPKSRCPLGTSRKGLQLVVSCEHGRVEVHAQGEIARLKTGDVLRWRGETAAEVDNSSARPATLVVVTLPLPLGR